MILSHLNANSTASFSLSTQSHSASFLGPLAFCWYSHLIGLWLLIHVALYQPWVASRLRCCWESPQEPHTWPGYQLAQGRTQGARVFPRHIIRPASPPAWAFGVAGEDVGRPLPLRPEVEGRTQIKKWAPGIPSVSGWGFSEHLDGECSEDYLFGTAEEKWLEQEHWVMAAEQAIRGMFRWGTKEGNFLPSPGPWAKTMVFTLSSDLLALHSPHRQPALCHRLGPP